MRALPLLTDLETQPAVFDQQTDDFTQTFASEFASSDALGQAATSDQATLTAGMDPISQAIDGLGGLLDDAGTIFDLLSGELDTVNLDPVIQNFQASDAALDSNLDNPGFDLSSAALSLLNDVLNAAVWVADKLLQYLAGIIDWLIAAVQNLAFQIGQMALFQPDSWITTDWQPPH